MNYTIHYWHHAAGSTVFHRLHWYDGDKLIFELDEGRLDAILGDAVVQVQYSEKTHTYNHVHVKLPFIHANQRHTLEEIAGNRHEKVGHTIINPNGTITQHGKRFLDYGNGLAIRLWNEFEETAQYLGWKKTNTYFTHLKDHTHIPIIFQAIDRSYKKFKHRYGPQCTNEVIETLNERMVNAYNRNRFLPKPVQIKYREQGDVGDYLTL